MTDVAVLNLKDRLETLKQESEFLTHHEVAAILKISSRTVVRRFEEGVIPGKKIGSKWRTTKTAMDKLVQAV